MSRTARIERQTKESKVLVELDLDGSGRTDVSTGVSFYDHMLTAFGRHALFDLTVQTDGDTHIDAHHTVEDTAIVLGDALLEALGDKSGIRRFGDSFVPLDESLVQCAVDVSGRPYCVHVGEPEGQEFVSIGDAYLGSLTRHVFETLAHHAQIALHVRVLSGRDPHHIVESQFKAVARALRDAVASTRARPGCPRPRARSEHRHVPGPRVTVLDYGSGNLRSAVRALERAGADVTLTADRPRRDGRRRARRPRRRRVRGVHAGAASVKGHEIIGRRLAGGRPVLGICVGMQILFEYGVEHGVTSEGCGEWPGVVERLQAPVVPHMGWNTVDVAPAPRCSRASRTSGSTSCTPTAYDAGTWYHTVAPGPAGDVGRARRRPVRGRGRERSADARPSSTRRSPATPARGCCATGSRRLVSRAMSKERARRREEREREAAIVPAARAARGRDEGAARRAHAGR